ncbi:hypothetical protein LNP17_09970 [Klebsiella variicola subsp. variicola]|nr:hypothetical protein [Klebsiella variicola subsp. variicola]
MKDGDDALRRQRAGAVFRGAGCGGMMLNYVIKRLLGLIPTPCLSSQYWCFCSSICCPVTRRG